MPESEARSYQPIYNSIWSFSNANLFLWTCKTSISAIVGYSLSRARTWSIPMEKPCATSARPAAISQDLRRKEPMHFFGMTSQCINGACGYYGLRRYGRVFTINGEACIVANAPQLLTAAGYRRARSAIKRILRK